MCSFTYSLVISVTLDNFVHWIDEPYFLKVAAKASV